MGLQEAINNIWQSDYVQKNPNKAYKASYASEYAAVTAFLNGGPEPNWSGYSKLGKGLCEAEKHRRSEVIVVPPVPPDPTPTPTGSLFAAPNGNDANNGTEGAPFKSVQKLSGSLQPGQTGMLRGGTYGTFMGYDGTMGIDGNGTTGNPVTITNYPGERVELRGMIWYGGNFLTIRNLHFDTTNNQRPDHGCGISAQPMESGGNDVIFEYNEIFQSGNNAYPSKLKNSGIYQGAGNRLIYRYNLIHDIGGCQALDHGLYIGHGSAEVYGNWIWNDAHGWGVQIYPECKNGKFHSNVIDKCGSGFVICDDAAGGTAGNDVYNNVIVNCIADNSNGQFGDRVKSSGAGISGMGTNGASNNKFRDNIVFNCPAGIAGETEPYWGVHPPPSNITITGNSKTDPMFMDAANHDYRLKAGSPAAAFGLPTTKPGPTV